MKGTQEQILSLLTAVVAGGVEIVEKEEDSDFDLQTALSNVHSNVETILRPTLESELTDKIKSEVAGLSAGALRSTLGQLTGVDRSLLKDLKDKDAITVALDHWKKALGAGEEDVLKMVEKAHADKDMEWGEKYNAIEQEANSWKNKYIDRNILEALTAELSNAPIPKTADKNVVAKDFKRELADNYILNYDEEKKALGLFMKDKPTIPANIDNVPVKLLDLAKGFLTPRGLWETDMRNQPPAEPTNQNGQPYVNPTNNPTPLGPDPIKQLNDSIQAYAAQQGVTQ